MGEFEWISEKARFEAVGEDYNAQMMLMARQKTWQALHRIADGIQPGMLEEEAVDLARRTLKDVGLLRGWHGIHVRFGTNTLKQFGEPSEPGVALASDDIYFIDIGPVWQRWEGDAGATFVVGEDAEMQRAARDVRTVFHDVRARWRDEACSGEALYRHAQSRARELGWELNLKMDGHRLADFPHAAIHKGPLAAATFTPAANLWVLEIQIRHPERPFSAFFEDLLVPDA